MNERQHYWDNIKGILILLVVAAHFMLQKDELSKAVYHGIYLFHMPLFIFISGLFHRHEKVRERVLSLIIIGILYNAALIVVDHVLLGKVQDFYLFKATKIPWFVLTIAMCTLLTYLFRDCSKHMILTVSVFLGCVACYDSSLMNYMAIAKMVSWYPFYFLGSMLDFKKIEKVLKSERMFSWAGGGILATYILVTVLGRNGCVSISKMAFLYGANRVYPTPSAIWIIVKLLYYAVVIVVSLSLLLVIPSQRVPGLTTLGRRTMQIYFWHIMVRSLMFAAGVPEYICISPAGYLLWTILSIVITGILSLDIFGFPTNWIIRSVKKR